MPTIDVSVDGDGAWRDLAGRDVYHLPDQVWKLAALASGMTSGKPSLALRLDLPNGEVVLAETSLAAWVAATVVLRARYPEAFTDTPLAER